MHNDNNIPEELLKPYNPKETEARIYQSWLESGFFNPDVCIEKGVTAPDAEPFSMVLPPPNVTGTLHTGHALMLVIEDIMTRFARMQGKRTLWLPGTDHAAIATQSKVEKIIEKEEGKRKGDLGREEFLKRVEKFAQESHDTIVGQAKRMGASLDWSREAFTLDAKRNLAVRTAFARMYNDGLIYRGHRIVNWDPKGQTVISDDELVYEERKAKLYTFKYSKDFPISISTTRPETKVGDTAVAVNPSDERYAAFVGKEYDAVFCGVPIHIKIVADESVEKEFGTGALGVTPAHSQIDAEIALRHKLPTVQVINEYAKMMIGGENLIGKKTTEAREIIAEWLRTEGLMEKEEDVSQNISTAERTGGIIEPLPKLQWFMNVNKKFKLGHSEMAGFAAGDEVTLKELMLGVVRSGQTRIVPENFERVYFHWIENLRDWCISRQIWYGHRIPVWYDKTGGIHLPKERTIIFVRHGQSAANVADTYAGQSNSPLTETGIAQAHTLAASLKGRTISKIFSSDLSRAQDTARIIRETLGVSEYSEHQELREISAGNLENSPRHTEPLLFAAFREKTGETASELIARAKKAWEIITNDTSDGDIIVVGHQSFTSIMHAVVDGAETEAALVNHRMNWTMGNATTREYTYCVNPTDPDLSQDEDTLDTWFSSGLWTFSTLGWPNKTPDLATYHPTTVLETGYDILPFWVARMILMSTYLTGQIPFKIAYLHGLVRDEKGRKMSKSLGNIIDPLTLVDEFGTDALRMAMIVGVGPGSDSNLGKDKIKAYAKFANKLWNIQRFVLESTAQFNPESNPTLEADDQTTLDEIDALMQEVTKEMEEYKFYLVAEKLYHYTWHTFADVVIERSKQKIASGAGADSARQMLVTALPILLRALHPFMPYITEELWSKLPGRDRAMLMVSKWPCRT
jgi:valyl-tRNA synthetase